MNNIVFQPLGDPVAAGESLQHIADIDPRLTRTHYFDGRLLTAEDLTRDQIYLDQRLREMGRVLGSGIIDGLQLSFDRFTGLLTLQPGQGATAAGRILELGSDLLVNLGDRALISQLNDGQYRRFNRALYAVVLRYVDVATDVAEVFPTDLASRRGSDYDLVTESVQMGLVPLPTPLGEQDPLSLRANLIREYLGDNQARGLVPEDAVALGVIAIANDTPQWLDSELLRQRLRREPGLSDLQHDLARQYEKLFADVMTARQSAGYNSDFAATDYFNLLPPVGTIGKDAINPVTGLQRFFPEHFQVSIAPLRLSDVELIKAESMGLSNIDLTRNEAVEIVVLAPLSNQLYGQYATQLERPFDADKGRLPHSDPLKLKLYPTRPVHQLDTDANVWQAIWEAETELPPFYVRRPLRAAETAISSIVLAQGFSMPVPNVPIARPINGPVLGPDFRPELNDGPTEVDTNLIQPRSSFEAVPTRPIIGPADNGGLIEDEDSVFLRRINFEQLGQLRTPLNNEGEQALETLSNNFGDDAQLLQTCLNILLRVERHYDIIIWPTLLALANDGLQQQFLDGLLAANIETVTGEVVVELGTTLGLNSNLLNAWSALLPE